MQPVRVLQVLTCDGLGGTELMVATLVERLDRSLVQPSVVTLEPRGPVAVRLGEAGVRVRSLGGSGLAVAFARLARILSRERFDVVNAYGSKSTAVTRVLVRALSPGSKFVNGVRGLHVAAIEDIGGRKSRALLTLERVGSRLVDAYDVNSSGAVELLAGAGIDHSRLHYIANGIDVDDWPVAFQDSGAGGRPIVVCVARFDPLKRHTDLIQAASRLASAGIDFRLSLIGGGPTLAESRELAARLGLDESTLTFHGPASPPQVRALLAESHLFCLPSLWEGMPGSVMEAMASGLPVVGTRVNGIADLIEHDRTGLLVPPRQPDRLAEALASLLHDRQLMVQFGAAGRERIKEHFGVDRMVAAKQRLFAELADAP